MLDAATASHSLGEVLDLGSVTAGELYATLDWLGSEQALKTADLELRPVFHWTAPRVRAHVLLCMLAYYLEWHMRQTLAASFEDTTACW